MPPQLTRSSSSSRASRPRPTSTARASRLFFRSSSRRVSRVSHRVSGMGTWTWGRALLQLGLLLLDLLARVFGPKLRTVRSSRLRFGSSLPRQAVWRRKAKSSISTDQTRSTATCVPRLLYHPITANAQASTPASAPSSSSRPSTPPSCSSPSAASTRPSSASSSSSSSAAPSRAPKRSACHSRCNVFVLSAKLYIDLIF